MRKVSMLDVARAAGVSKNTVSLALRNDPRIPPDTRQRIEGAARRLDYHKNPVVSHLMAQLRTGAQTRYKATLALLNANDDQAAFKRHPTIPTYVEGCRRRAAQQGYTLDEFWLADPELSGERLQRIFESRGIDGAVVVGMMHRGTLSSRYQTIWQNYPCVVTGVRTRGPALSFACSDHHDLALQATENALRLGYRRPGLLLDAEIDELLDGRFTAGMHIAQRVLPSTRRLSPLYLPPGLPRDLKKPEELFRAWFAEKKPDVILTLYHTVAAWVKRLGLSVPGDLGLIQLEWRSDHAHWAGMNQHNDLVGEASVDMLIGMIHNAERGVPAAPRATLIGSSWVGGSTVRTPTSALAPAR